MASEVAAASKIESPRKNRTATSSPVKSVMHVTTTEPAGKTFLIFFVCSWEDENERLQIWIIMTDQGSDQITVDQCNVTVENESGINSSRLCFRSQQIADFSRENQRGQTDEAIEIEITDKTKEVKMKKKIYWSRSVIKYKSVVTD